MRTTGTGIRLRWTWDLGLGKSRLAWLQTMSSSLTLSAGISFFRLLLPASPRLTDAGGTLDSKFALRSADPQTLDILTEHVTGAMTLADDDDDDDDGDDEEKDILPTLLLSTSSISLTAHRKPLKGRSLVLSSVTAIRETLGRVQ
ncbi:hypothetical protein PoB_000793200 [Plakobranchus ocellatus]|uniref:Uncharacterized protein n=1 Tax=Plakobranchus ocellatus TaxID=259542 RepID=A0AAV3YGS3_9GAST|nr:hypothetical protein PoB_000793200 [Plakobranchus ocellatus]